MRLLILVIMQVITLCLLVWTAYIEYIPGEILFGILFITFEIKINGGGEE